MFKIQKSIFQLSISHYSFWKHLPIRLQAISLSNVPYHKYTSQKEEVSVGVIINPIIEKDEKEDFQEVSEALKKKTAVVEENLYSYESTTPKLDVADIDNPFIYPSKYGNLKLIACPIASKQLKDIKGIHYFNDKASTNYIKKILKSDKKCLLVFDSETHYKNISDLYRSIEKMLKNIYFGSKQKPRNPFSHCKSPKEIFNLNRRILIELKQNLNKILFLMNYDGSPRLKGNVPRTNLVKPHLTQKYKDMDDPFAKHDYLIPYNIYQGMVNAESFEKSGIPIKSLSDKKIYPLYGVWTPTKQGFLDLLADYIDKNLKKFQQMKNVIDLGCGTGILSFILLLRGGVSKTYAIDRNPIAVRNSRMNAEILEVGDKYICETIKLGLNSEENAKALEKMRFPKKYDLIITNPPWIVASYINEKNDLDNGVYDPEEEMLIGSFLFSSSLFSFFI